MVKKGEYIDYAISLEEKSIDYNPTLSVKELELVLPTNISMIVEIAKKVNELEERILKLEEVRK